VEERKMPVGFRVLKQDGGEEEGEADGEESLVGPATGRPKKKVEEGYMRADTLNLKSLKKYVKSVSREIELYREARK
jgi:hypothetical protein